MRSAINIVHVYFILISIGKGERVAQVQSSLLAASFHEYLSPFHFHLLYVHTYVHAYTAVVEKQGIKRIFARRRRWQTAARRATAAKMSLSGCATRRDTVATHYNLLCGSGLLEKGSLYAHGYHARSPSNNEATGCRPHHTLYDRLCNLDGPYNPTCQPFTPTGHFMAADQADRTRPFYESLLKTNRERERAPDRKRFLRNPPTLQSFLLFLFLYDFAIREVDGDTVIYSFLCWLCFTIFFLLILFGDIFVLLFSDTLGGGEGICILGNRSWVGIKESLVWRGVEKGWGNGRLGRSV